MKEWSDFGIEVGNKISGQIYTTCPQCSHNRKKKNQKCLGVNLDKGIWHCCHPECDWSGSLGNKSYALPKWENVTPLSDTWVEYFLSRNINQETLVKMSLSEGIEFMPGAGRKVSTIQFPYKKNGQVVNIKYRDVDKNFMLAKGAELIFYNIDGLKGEDEAIIVEGEIDALTLIQKGFTNTISVPNGASKGENKLIYVDLGDFKNINKILIATDNDEPGNKLADDLARLLGVERCHRLELGEFKDINEMLCKQGDIDLLNITPFKELLTAQVSEIWKDILISEEPEDDKPLLFVDTIPVLTEGNHTLIVGKKKSRKTLFLVWLLSLYKGNDCLFFDTEQGRKHVWKIRERVKQLSGIELPVFFLRGKSPKDRRDIILQTVANWPTRPRVIIIDGIRDLMSNINDPDESTELIVWLEALIKDFNVGVINVLHLNKTDNNARGHIGTELLNKCFMSIELEKDAQTGISQVKCTDSRDLPFEPFAIQHDTNGLPEILDMPTKGNALTEDESRTRLQHVFDGEQLKRKEAVDGIRQHFEIGRDKANNLLGKFIREGLIIKSGKDRSPNTVYKLI
jgi:5S rRNA maturation endonuclease (ribonuclease M5)